MKFNHVIDTLRLGCRELSREYWEEYGQHDRESQCFFRYLVTGEIEAQLCTLMDTEFSDFEEFVGLVRGILTDYGDVRLEKPPEDALGCIREAEEAFLALLEQARPDCETPEIPYFRYLTGKERENVITRFREQWGYIPHKYWYPMNGQEIREDCLFLHTDHVEDYWPRIEQLLGLPEKHIYCYGEGDCAGRDCMEMTELDGYNGFENACCGQDFFWLVYFSHEETVTFAGSILPRIREILAPEKTHWNRWN